LRVPAEGPKNAKIMVLGESPGSNEWKRGKPFIGQSGDIINDVFTASGIKRSQIYITNVIKDHLPPWGDYKRAFFFQGGHPTKEYLDGIIEVVKEIREVKPNVVMPLGNYALWALMQHEGVSKWRGSILESTIVEGLKVIPSLHPAFFINARNMWHRLAMLEWDFRRVVRESEFPEIREPNPTILVDPTPAEMLDAVDRYTSCDSLMIDTEWYNADSLAYIGFADSKDYATVIPNTSMHAQRAYRAILQSDIPKDSQNGWAFDLPALARQGFDIVNPGDDLMVAWNSCWASLRSKSLATICSILTDQKYYKDEVEFVGRDEKKGQLYCGTDCVVQYEALDKIKKEEFPITNGQIGYEISKSAAPFFIESTKIGILIDNEKRKSLRDIHLEKADEIEDALSATIGYSINCRSFKQVQALVFDQLLPAYGIKRTKRTSAQEYLMDIAGSTKVEAVQLILGSIIRVRQNRNIVSRYLHDGILDIDGRARTNWNLAGTRSGRFSSTIPWWPGLAFQTVPDDARDIFIADPGHVFIGFDYRQAEAVVVALLTYNHDLLDDLETGVDIHTLLASQLPFGKTYDELLKEIDTLLKAGKSKDDCRPRYISKKCFLPGTELLTRSGWKAVESINNSESIASWSIEGRIQFEVPSEWIREDYSGQVISVKGRAVSQLVTDNHRLPVENNYGRISEIIANDLPITYGRLPLSGVLDDEEWHTDEVTIRLLAATWADGYHPKGYNQTRFGFTKERKIHRLRQLLQEACLDWRENDYRYKGGANHISVKAVIPKSLTWELINLPLKIRLAFLNELPYWDGTIEENRVRIFNTDYSAMEIISTIAHISGFSANIVKHGKPVGNRKQCWTMTIRESPFSAYTSLEVNKDKYIGPVYCPTVSTGWILTRRDGKISISGNSRHAFNYVEGADTFALQVNREWINTGIGIGRTEARDIRKQYLGLNPGLETWWDEVKRTLYDQKYIDNSFGRRRFVLGKITDKLIREMVSYYPQSTIGDLCTQGIVKVCQALPYAQVLLHMHDGGMFQVPEDKVDEAYETMMDLVVWPIRVGREMITIKADGKRGYSWGEMR